MLYFFYLWGVTLFVFASVICHYKWVHFQGCWNSWVCSWKINNFNRWRERSCRQRSLLTSPSITVRTLTEPYPGWRRITSVSSDSCKNSRQLWQKLSRHMHRGRVYRFFSCVSIKIFFFFSVIGRKTPTFLEIWWNKILTQTVT